MIRMLIEISESGVGPKNDFGATVSINTGPIDPRTMFQGEGQTWADLCMAIDECMRLRGVPNYDCMRRFGAVGADGGVRQQT